MQHVSVLLWLDDHLLCGTEALFLPALSGGAAPLPPFVKLAGGEPHFVRARILHNETTSAASFALKWRVNGGTPVTIPLSSLRVPSPKASQLERDSLQSTLATGWGTWWRPSALAATLLPEEATLTVGLCQLSCACCQDPSAPFTPEQSPGPEEPHSEATARPGMHAYDRSYWQLFLSFRGLNVSLEWAGTNAGGGASAAQNLTLLATVVSGNASDFVLLTSASFVFQRAGRAKLTPQGLQLEAAGLRQLTAQPLTPLYVGGGLRLNSSQPFIALKLGASRDGASAWTTAPWNLTLSTVLASMRSIRRAASATMDVPRDARNRAALVDAADAMTAVLMWNTIFHPTQLGPFVCVSRSFSAQPYEIFEWDTFFGAMMLSSDARGLALALSSLIQVVKSKTVGPALDLHGFVPNYSKGGRWLSEDRPDDD